MIQQRKNSFLVLLVAAICFVSCDSNGVLDEYKKIPDNEWNLKEAVHFNFSISDTISKNNLYINIRNNNEYSFSNLYLISHLYFPNGNKIVDTLQYEMTDNSGRFLGDGFAEIKNSKLFYKENVQFPVSGEYSLDIYQAMRENNQINGIENLQGITDVGFRIEKTN